MKSERIKEAILIIVSFVIGGVLTFIVIDGKDLLNKTTTTSSASSGLTCSAADCTKVVVDESGISEAVEKVYDGILMIRNYQNDEVASTGTGFVYKIEGDDAYVITNQHVVDGADRITLITSTDEEIEGEVLGGDSYVDIAIVRMKKTDDLVALTLGNSENSKLGDLVFTIGNPLGYEYRGSVSTGHLAGKDRLVSVSTDNNSSSSDWVMKVLQTDAAINPGNSGGPLMNANGEVIGVISLKLVQTEVEGMGFAIPIEYVNSKIETLEKGESIEWPVLGVQMLNVSDAKYSYRYNFDIPNDVDSGVVIAGIEEGTGAASSDLKAGDIVTAINGVEVSDSAYLRYELYKYQAGDTIELTYLRAGEEHTTKVKLSKSE
ncbi:MAG TPA: trypsin-like peptidase domain-containing protein [Candidatus Onthousia faecavium]|nr:trypsin-like peptidase domain-containing protein [Candidatus Onthousia faecavium]